MSANNGGPAFPQADLIANEFHAGYGLDRGMTLRDYFAAKAMQSLVMPADCVGEDFQVEAKTAYRIADAMLKERVK